MLLPVLGLTWLIGIISVNENTTSFAWIFTILNSLQVRGYLLSIKNLSFDMCINREFLYCFSMYSETRRYFYLCS